MKRLVLLFLLCICVVDNQLSSQVRLQTGSAEYSIPIFSYSDKNSGLSTSISLNYSSGSGLKVSDVASNVGTGWAIVTGGFIQRIQIGEPDDQNSLPQFPKAPINCNVLGFNHSVALAADGDEASINYINNYYPNGFLYSEFEPINQTDYLTELTPSYCNVPRELALSPRFKSSMDKRWKQSRRALADREQDIFIFSFGGRVGQFVIGRNGNITVMPDSRIQVKTIESDMTSAGIQTRIVGFEIIDETGLKYTFSDYDKSEIGKMNSVINSATLSVSESVGTDKYIISKWNLSQIENTVAKGSIVFSYEDEIVEQLNNYSSNFQKIEGSGTDGSVGVFHDLSKSVIKRLKTIDFSDKVTMVKFVYKDHSRHDLAGSAPLQDIEIYYEEKRNRFFHFETGYFVKKVVKELNAVEADDRIYARLALKSVQEIGGEAISKIPSFQFQYYTGFESSDELEIVPPQFTFAQDMWGYYNKSSAASINIADLSSNIVLLRELHTNQRIINNVSAKLGLLKSVRLPEGGRIIYDYEQNRYFETDHEILVGGVRVFKTIVTDDFNEENDITTKYSYTTSEGKSSLWGYEPPNNSTPKIIRILNAAPGYDYDKPGDEFTKLVTALGPKLISFGKAATGVKPTGAVFAHAAFFYVLTNFIIPAVLTLFNPYEEYTLLDYSFYPNWYHNPLPMQYSEVSVTTADRRDKTVNKFRSPSNPEVAFPPLVFPYSSKTRVANWEYGQPLSVEYFNAGGKKVKDINYVYTVKAVSNVADIQNRSVKAEPHRIYSARCEYFTYTIPVTDFSYDFYAPVTGHSQLKSINENTYNPETQEYITKETLYEYNECNFMVSKTTEILSEGLKKQTRIYYPCDYNKNFVKQADDMLQKNLFGVPISTEIWQTHNGGWEMTGATVAEFKELNTPYYRPVKIHTFLSNDPEPESGVIGEFDRDKLVRNTALIPLASSIGYDLQGNPVDFIDNLTNAKSCKIFDDINNYPIADVMNASFNEVAYTSFEIGQTKTWTIDGNGFIETGSTVTGTNYILGENYVITSPPLEVANNKYKLSFWAKHNVGDIITVRIPLNNSAFSPYINKPVINGWTYYEYNLDVPLGSNIKVEIQGKGGIDEVRIYPSKARMKTVNYYVPHGKTSECDENNRIRYYEYDDLGRLIMVKDEYKDAIKTYEYHYKYNE